VDESELELSHPLVSISLGQRGVYLTGGRTPTTTPTAMWLVDGDVVVMSGAQRLVRRGVFGATSAGASRAAESVSGRRRRAVDVRRGELCKFAPTQHFRATSSFA